MAVEKYIKKSLQDSPTSIHTDTKYKICSRCGATIPNDTRICACGAEYSTISLTTDLPAKSQSIENPKVDDTIVDSEFDTLKKGFGNAESELEKIAEEIAVSVKGDFVQKEKEFMATAASMQDMILRLQQEITDMRSGFDKIAENIANEVRDEIKKHEDGKIHVIESRVKETLDKLHNDMRREGASLKEEDTKIRSAKKELYEEVNKLMDRLKRNEKELIEREKALSSKELELEKRKNDLESALTKKEIELEKRKTDLEKTLSERTAEDVVKTSDAWKAEETRLKNEIEKMKKVSDEWKKQETMMKSDLERLKRESENWKKEETKLKEMISHMEISGGEGETDRHAEIAKMQSKILVALLKENPDFVKKVIKEQNISKEDLKKLVS